MYPCKYITTLTCDLKDRSPYLDKQSLDALFKKSYEISLKGVKMFGKNIEKTLNYKYDTQGALIHPSNDYAMNVKPHTLDEFINIMGRTGSTQLEIIFMGAQSDLHKYGKVSVKSQIDFSQIITDLSIVADVSIEKSMSLICLDERTFTLDGGTYQVDCLGTNLCEDITRKVLKMWKDKFN
jgi:hypothetical protein